MHSLRLFVAIDTPPQIKRLVAAVRDRLQGSGADARWEPDDKLHCTIRFLGDTDPRDVDRIISSVQQIAGETPCFTVRYRTVGCFPSIRDPHVVWIGIDPADDSLRTLQRRVEETVVSIGFTREDRPFHPHLTLGRVKSRKNIRNLLTVLETVTFESEPVILGELEIIKSELKPAGSVYTILKSIPLKA